MTSKVIYNNHRNIFKSFEIEKLDYNLNRCKIDEYCFYGIKKNDYYMGYHIIVRKEKIFYELIIIGFYLFNQELFEKLITIKLLEIELYLSKIPSSNSG